eukprot:scaffold323634_cov86-Cyclotella_meneghiniana.AAC.2
MMIWANTSYLGLPGIITIVELQQPSADARRPFFGYFHHVDTCAVQVSTHQKEPQCYPKVGYGINSKSSISR